MKSKLGMITAMLLTMILATYPEYVSAQTNTDGIWKADANSRTWQIYDVVGAEHMSVEDKFRVKMTNDGIRFIPLYRLRHRWGLMGQPGANVVLIPVDLKNETGVVTYFCGLFDIETPEHLKNEDGHGLPHGFLIRITEYDMLEIIWSDRNPDSLEASIEEQCKDLQHHGGIVHANPIN